MPNADAMRAQLRCSSVPPFSKSAATALRGEANTLARHRRQEALNRCEEAASPRRKAVESLAAEALAGFNNQCGK